MLWIVGHAFQDIRDYLQSHGIAYGVLVNKAGPTHPALHDVPTVALDFRSAETLRASADAAAINISAVLVAGYENYVLPAAILAQHYELPGLSLTAATATTDKAVMRASFRTCNPAITPDFAIVNTWEDTVNFMGSHTYPVMLKPTNLMKSLFITKNDSPSDLRTNYDPLVTALSAVVRKIYTMEPPGIIIEECLIGSMHTVAGYVDAAGHSYLFSNIVDCVTGQDVGKQENYIYSRQLPSLLDSSHVTAILAVARQGVEALKLTSTMLHIEIILTADGPKIIEIGARVGGYRTRMYTSACGINMNGIMVDLALGKPPLPLGEISHPASIAVLELFPDSEGIFQSVTNLEKLHGLPSFSYFSLKPQPGDSIGRSSHGFKASAVVILTADDRQQFNQDLAFVTSEVRIIVAA